MTADRNPFTVLGFNQNVLKDLSDDAIKILAKNQYRTLAGIHHPDKGGNVNRFKEIQEAFDKLQEDYEFEFWKNNFLRLKKDHLEEARKEKNAAITLAQSLHEALVNYWMYYCHGKYVIKRRPSSEIGGARFKELVDSLLGEIDGFSIFDPMPCSMLLARCKEDHQFFLEKDGAKSLELKITPSGLVTCQNLVKTYFDVNEPWRPPVRREWIALITARGKNYYWKPEGDPVVLEGKLIGSLPIHFIPDEKKYKKNLEVAGLISTDVKFKSLPLTEDGIDVEDFKPYLHFIEPRIMRDQYVVCAKHVRNNLYFRLLGHVRMILPLEETKEKS